MTLLYVNYTTSTPPVQGYQEISNGVVERITDLNGNDLKLPKIYEADIVDSNPPFPQWGTQDMEYILIEWWTKSPPQQAWVNVEDSQLKAPADQIPPPQQITEFFDPQTGQQLNLDIMTVEVVAKQPPPPDWAK